MPIRLFFRLFSLALSVLIFVVTAQAAPKPSLLFVPVASKDTAPVTDQVMRWTKWQMETVGFRGEVNLSSGEMPRFLRRVSEKQLRQSDLENLTQPEVAVRVCQVMSYRLAVLMKVTQSDETSATVSLTLVNPETEQWEEISGITAQQTEFIPNPKKPKKKEIKSAAQVAGEKIAQELMERAQKLPPPNPQQRQTLAAAHLAKAKDYAARNETGAALDEAYQVMALAPHNPEPYVIAGDIAAAQSEWDTARIQYERARQKLPDDAALWVKLANVYMAQSRTDVVIQMIGKGVPPSADANVLAAKAYLARREIVRRAGLERDAREDLKKAQEFYARAVALSPDNVDLATAYVDLLAQSFDYDKMAEALRQIIKVVPDRAAFYERLSDVLARQKKYDEAFDALAQAWSRTKPQPFDMTEESYRKSAVIVDARLERLFGAFVKIAVELDQAKLTKEQAFSQMQDLRQQTQAVVHALDLVNPPAALEESHLHRQTAAALLAQALGAAKTFIDTDSGDYESRAGTLLRTAREELKSASVKSQSSKAVSR
jgi:tetratricopeptide (TPR) repeat protein